MNRKLVLVVVDAMHPGRLRDAIDSGEAPTFAALAERGELVDDMVASFPSVTPVCCSEMMTGVGPRNHHVMGMNWYHRLEQRYIEYGTSFEATRTFGLFRAMYDLVYNMNLDHLSWETETVFELLGDAGVRTALTPFLIYRGRSRHKLGLEGLVKRAAAAANFRHAVWGPDEFFYGDLYASRPTGCGPSFTRPGVRDDYSACVAEELVREDAYDFMLLSLPDNDFHSHRFGPDAQPESIAKADTALERVIQAGGGLDEFLEANAVILTADHAQSAVEHGLPLADSLAERWEVLQPNEDRPDDAEIAVSPTSRAGAVYVLGEGAERAATHDGVRAHLRDLDGVDLVCWLADDHGVPIARDGVGLESGMDVWATVVREGRELSFRPGGALDDRRGAGWTLKGEPEALQADITGGHFDAPEYPDGLTRLWSALTAPHAGDVMISLADGYECRDWGGISHAGGGSHGALSREDSLAPLLMVGCGPDRPGDQEWSLRDIMPVVLDHFGVAAGEGGRVSPVETARRIGRGARRSENWIQLIQFGLVGASGYVVNLTVFAVLTGAGLFFRDGSDGLGMHHIPAAILAFTVAVTNNFFWNRRWTFSARHGHAGFQAARFLTVSVLALGVNLVVLEALIRADVGELAAQAVAVAVAMPFNFIGNKIWTFDEPPPESRP